MAVDMGAVSAVDYSVYRCDSGDDRAYGVWVAEMMDAVEFLKEKSRMCNAFNLCDGGGYKEACKLYKEGLTCADYTNDYPEKAVEIVERWAKEHPRKTRQSEFLKMHPDAHVFQGTLAINPCQIEVSRLNTEECHTYADNEAGCLACRDKYWNEEVE